MLRRRTLVVLLGLICLSFFGALAVSASMFPNGYDWRYRVISNLLSPRDNPQHYWLAAWGVALTGGLMLPFCFHLKHGLERIAPWGAWVSAGAFLLGIIALICDCFVVPQHVHATIGIRRFHEFLARSSAGLLAAGMLASCWCAWKGGGRVLPLLWRCTWCAVTAAPLVGVFCSESLLLFARFDPALALPIRRTFRHSVFWHLGFWEWIGAGAVFAFLCGSIFLADSVQEARLER